jgi:hypothetical protein
MVDEGRQQMVRQGVSCLFFLPSCPSTLFIPLLEILTNTCSHFLIFCHGRGDAGSIGIQKDLDTLLLVETWRLSRSLLGRSGRS